MSAQLSEDWFSKRRPITGSRISTALGKNPWNKPEDLIRELVRQEKGERREFDGNIATRWGTAHEIDGLNWYEAETGNMVAKHDISIHPSHDFISYSADGLTADGLIEIKAPFSQKIPNEVPEHYWLQVQLGMEVLNLPSCAFIYWTEKKQKLFKIERDKEWFAGILPDLEMFRDYYLSEINNPAHLEPLVSPLEGKESEYAVIAYLSAKRALEAAAYIEKQAKKALIETAGNKSAKGFGITLSKVERQGSIQWAKWAKDNDVEPDEKYRGKPSSSFRITESGK